jgi:hypothetical protein
LGRIVQHTHLEDWQKTGDAQYITCHIHKKSNIWNYWACTYNSMMRGEKMTRADGTLDPKGARAIVNDGDYLWWILKRFHLEQPTSGAAIEYPWAWQLVPYVKSWNGAPSPVFYCDHESQGAAIYVGKVSKVFVNGWNEREDHDTAIRATFPRGANPDGYKRHLLQLSKLEVFLGI